MALYIGHIYPPVPYIYIYIYTHMVPYREHTRNDYRLLSQYRGGGVGGAESPPISAHHITLDPNKSI